MEVLRSDELVEEPSDYGALRPGTRLGRYELLVPIARGGMARVWAARLHGQHGLQKLVAIKTILPHLAREREFERMFLDEARIASGLHHPNVCEIYELGDDKGTLYLAMEWVTGDSFARILRPAGGPEPLDARVAARVVADACAGLHAAHELADDSGRHLGVVHRDVSPQNILVTGDGVAKVADFGVAKALGQLHENTRAGQLKGKLHYMAPEQVTGAGVDRRSDVFSLGCVLYEATTGVRPFNGDDHQILGQLIRGDFAVPSSVWRGYPPDLERIVLCAMAPQPNARFPSTEHMRFALEDLLARGPLVTHSSVAQVLRQRLGEDLERRRERIRQASTIVEHVAPRRSGFEPTGAQHQANAEATGWLGPAGGYAAPLTVGPVRPLTIPPFDGHAYPPPNAMPLASGPVGAPLPPLAEEPPLVTATQYAMAAGAGVLLAIAIGLGGFFAVRAKHEPGAAGAPSASPAIHDRLGAPVAFQVEPPNAALAVDGVPLAPGAREIPRPAAGRTVMVVASAPGHDDATVLVDYFTNGPIVLTLKPAESQPQPAAEVPLPEASAATSVEPSADAEAPKQPVAGTLPAEQKEPPKPRPMPKKIEQPALPDNPY